MNASITDTLISLIVVDSIGSIIIRGLIWIVLMSIIAIGTAKGQKVSNIKSETGFFLFFVVLSGFTIYLMFGVIPTVSSKPTTDLFLPTLISATLPGLYQLNKTASYFLQT